MAQKKSQEKGERQFELQSEKVRSIIGQMPPALTRYGITFIGIALLLLFWIAYMLPYKKVYTGHAFISHRLSSSDSRRIDKGEDSIEIVLLLHFEGSSPRDEVLPLHSSLQLETSGYPVTTNLLTLSTQSDTRGRHLARCQIATRDTLHLTSQSYAFYLTLTEGSLLQQLLPHHQGDPDAFCISLN